MDDICNRVYESSLFKTNRIHLEKQGKSKEKILNIIKINLTNATSENNDLPIIIKSQIINILQDEYQGDISQIIRSIFKEYYINQPSKLEENLMLFKKYCDDNSNVSM